MKGKTMNTITTVAFFMGLGVIAKLMFDGIRRRRKEISDVDRTHQLSIVAKRTFPRMSESLALEFFAEQLQKDIVFNKKNKRDTRDLVRDHILAIREHFRLVDEEVERDSQYTNLRAAARV